MEFTKDELIKNLREHFYQINMDLSEDAYERFARFIISRDIYCRKRLKHRRETAEKIIYTTLTGKFSLENFYEYVDTIYNFLDAQGYGDEDIKRSMETMPTLFRFSLPIKLPIYEALGVKDRVLIDYPRLLTIPIEVLHARKMYMLENGIEDPENRILLTTKHSTFQRRCNIDTPRSELVKRYPLTEEAKYIFRWIKGKSDEELMYLFKMTREEILSHYPTSKDELESIQIVGYYSDEQLLNKYGMNKEQLFSRYPLNHKVLNVIRKVHVDSQDEKSSSGYCKVIQ